MSDELEKDLKIDGLGRIKLLFQKLPVRAEENNENPQS
jgi:hypothetical protein